MDLQKEVERLEALLLQQNAMFSTEAYRGLPCGDRLALCTENYKTRKAYDTACASLLQDKGY